MSKEKRFEVFYNDELGKWVIKDNKEMPYLLDNYKSCVRLNEFAEKVDNLQSQLAEKDKVIIILEKQNKALVEEEDLLTEKLKELGVDCIEDLGKSQNQKAIEQLDKIKARLKYLRDIEISAVRESRDYGFTTEDARLKWIKEKTEISKIYNNEIKFLDQQIALLKGEKK